ncbi:MAG: SAM-dependent methyltransferase [Spirochaetota bacterium]
MNTMSLKEIGTVRSRAGEYSVQLHEEYRDGLAELGGFGYVHVLFWCHHLDAPEYRAVLSAPKPYRLAPETVGIFATRSPVRPNPIALSPCPVLSVDREAGVIQLAYIDAEDGSPVLDIKPYHPSVDRVRDAAVPQWCAHWPRWIEDGASFDWEGEFVNAR